ncbi:hypothetical protein RJ639_031878 [Escallonia herrerae]|uniref:Uncharacterized protein n=1 Tax=Escallonia herrerae TaxID=1293975 RepID=A0AA88X1I9_9ASTE|nr:hypothetical protein RJ639_031878 [Escallonia herrerae]
MDGGPGGGCNVVEMEVVLTQRGGGRDVFQGKLGLNFLPVLLILGLVLLSLFYHLLNHFLGQPSFVIGDSDLRLLASEQDLCRDTQDTVCIQLKAFLDLRNSPKGWRNLHQSIVKVLPSKVSVTCCGLHFNYTLFNSEKRDIKSTTTKIENKNVLCTNSSSFLLHTISEGSSRWLIDDALYIETGNSSSILGCLALGVIEIGRDSYYSILYFCPKKCLSRLTHLNQDHGRYLLGGKLLLLAFVTDHNHGLVSRTRSDLKWPELDITLYRCIAESPTNQSLCICHSLKQQQFS